MTNFNCTLKDFPYYPAETLPEIAKVVREITNTRKDDISTVGQFPEIFVLGRKVGKIPSASNDVVATDRIGDFNVDISYAYYLIDNSGTAEWRRVAVGSW